MTPVEAAQIAYETTIDALRALDDARAACVASFASARLVLDAARYNAGIAYDRAFAALQEDNS